jgi:hypothetical protein
MSLAVSFRPAITIRSLVSWLLTEKKVSLQKPDLAFGTSGVTCLLSQSVRLRLCTRSDKDAENFQAILQLTLPTSL